MYLATSILVPNTWFYGPNDWSITVLGYLYIGSQHMVLWSKCLKNNSVLGYLYIVNYNILVQFYFNKYVHVQNELLSIC